MLGGYKVKVIALDLVNGEMANQYFLNSEGDLSSPESMIFVGSNNVSPLIIWPDKTHKNLKINILGDKNLKVLSIPNHAGEDITSVHVHTPRSVSSQPHFLVHYRSAESGWAEVFHIDLSKSDISKAYSLPKTRGQDAFSASSADGANVYFTRVGDDEVSIVSSVSHGILGRWLVRKEDAGHLLSNGPTQAVAEVSSKGGTNFAVRSARVLQSGDWELVQNAEALWSRPESLSGAVAAAWVESPSDGDLVQELEIEGHGNPLRAYIHRLGRHARDLRSLPSWLEHLPARIVRALVPSKAAPSIAQDAVSFGYQKQVVLATDKGRLILLDASNSGQIQWSIQAVELQAGQQWNVKDITVEDSMVKVYQGEGNVLQFELSSGRAQPQSTETTAAPEAVFTAPGDSKPSFTVHLGTNGAPSGIDKSASTSHPILCTISEDNTLSGFSFDVQGKTNKLWSLALERGERLLHAVTRPSHDPVASIGRVLGDRSVAYKYLNPNLVLLTTVSDSASTATFYLLDAASGELLHSDTQVGVDTTRPIPSLLVENWFVYSFWGDIASDNTSTSETKSYQLVVSDLYESSIPNDRGPLNAASNYTSHGASDAPHTSKPYVSSQAYLINEGISSMAVSSTRQSITSRQLLCTLSDSNAVVGIPRHLIDPRRPVGRDPTAAEQEEGLFRYMPVLEFNPQWYITHQNEPIRLKKIITTPSKLESTSLVFAFGGDIFGTRTSPSQAFDVLGVGFNRMQLIATVVALWAGVLVLAPMVRKKGIDAQWKIT